MAVTPARRSSLYDLGVWADRTALHEAASQGRTLQVRQLIQSQASVNMVTVDNITPLHEACSQAHVPCARVLLEAGAQVDVRNIHGSTALCNACRSGSVECVQLLLQYGAKVNPSLTSLTASPLHEACIHGKEEIVHLMIVSGAHLEAYDVHLGPPLHVACAQGHLKCARLLLLAGAQVNSKKFHQTALHHAAGLHMPDLVQLLLDFGADVQATDQQGKKALDLSTPGSPSHTCLRLHEGVRHVAASFAGNPLSLQHLCRICVRRVLGTRASKVIGQLDAPPIIQSYLQFSL